MSKNSKENSPSNVKSSDKKSTNDDIVGIKTLTQQKNTEPFLKLNLKFRNIMH